MVGRGFTDFLLAIDGERGINQTHSVLCHVFLLTVWVILYFVGWFAFCIFEMLEVGLDKDSGTFMAK